MTATTEPSERALDAACNAYDAVALSELPMVRFDDMRAAILAYLATDETIAALRRDAERYNKLKFAKVMTLYDFARKSSDEWDSAIDALPQAETEGG